MRIARMLAPFAIVISSVEPLAEACDRAQSPLETLTVAAAVADVVVVADVTRVTGGVATATITDTLFGPGVTIRTDKVEIDL